MTILSNITIHFKRCFSVLTITFIMLFNAAQAEMLMATDIEVNDNVLRLGDVFDVKGLMADVKLFKAPPLGRRGTLSATNLMEIANKYNIDWQNIRNISSVSITRKAVNIDDQNVKKMIREYAIAHQHIGGDSGNTNIMLFNSFNTIMIAASDVKAFYISDFKYQPINDQFNVELSYTQAGMNKRIYLKGKIENLLRIPVFATNIRRNQTIKTSDIKYIQINNRLIAQNIILNQDDIIGKAAKNNIRAMQPIAEYLLKSPELVKQNSIIRLSFKLGRINLTLKARALTAGSQGSLIKVMNLKSGKQIDAIVTGKDQAMTINSITQKATKIASYK